MSINIKQLSKEDMENKELFEFITSLHEEENGFRNPWYYVKNIKNFSDWLDIMIKIDKGEYIVEGEAKKHTIYWIYHNDVPVGIGKIRKLDEEEKKNLGHIGYYILPLHRGKGFATKAFMLLAEEAKGKQNIEEVIVSIHKENLASRKIAEKCGAKLKYIKDNIACKYCI